MISSVCSTGPSMEPCLRWTLFLSRSMESSGESTHMQRLNSAERRIGTFVPTWDTCCRQSAYHESAVAENLHRHTVAEPGGVSRRDDGLRPLATGSQP